MFIHKSRVHRPPAVLIGGLTVGLVVSLGCDQQVDRQSAERAPVTRRLDDSNGPKPVPTEPKSWPTQRSREDENSITPAPATADLSARPEATSLFDGKTLAGWKPTNFGSEGECLVEEGHLTISAGYPMNGVTSTRDDLPTTNYELSLESRRTLGSDFFCGLTFPVADSHCTLIVGGWAGPVVGLSCIDDLDAANNETLKLMKFETDQWYRIKVRVQPGRIQAWIDAERVIDLDIEGRKISLRIETLPTRPLGICSFETWSQCKNIQLRLWPLFLKKKKEPQTTGAHGDRFLRLPLRISAPLRALRFLIFMNTVLGIGARRRTWKRRARGGAEDRRERPPAFSPCY